MLPKGWGMQAERSRDRLPYSTNMSEQLSYGCSTSKCRGRKVPQTMSHEGFPLHRGSGCKESQRESKIESISKFRKSELWQADYVRNGLIQSARALR